VKVFPIKLKDGTQDKVEAVVQEFAPKGPGAEHGTLSFRVYRDLAKPDYLLFVEHFADQAAYDAHTSSPAYRDLIAGRFAGMIAGFTELDHELVVGLQNRLRSGGSCPDPASSPEYGWLAWRS
jgi:quinol monooxygenase YgiN